MDTPIAPAIIAALVAILFGSFSAALVSHVLTSYRANKEFRLKKLEDLFIAVQLWNKIMRNRYYYWKEFSRAAMTWKTAVERAAADGSLGHPHYSAAIMITNVYFPELLPSINRLEQLDNTKSKSVNELHRTITEFETHQLHPVSEKEFDSAAARAVELRDEFNKRVYDVASDVRRGTVLTFLRNHFNG